uniref:Uncharacterized protein n=1 Tax=Anopheles atroparvus TaxID=41427 RepID=A0A182J936_ANOAO
MCFVGLEHQLDLLQFRLPAWAAYQMFRDGRFGRALCRWCSLGLRFAGKVRLNLGQALALRFRQEEEGEEKSNHRHDGKHPLHSLWTAKNMRRFAIEYEMECAMPRISVGNSSAVIVQGIVSSPIMEEQTYSSRPTTGIHVSVVVPSLIHSVNSPDTNMQMAMPVVETITRWRRANRFSSHAFSKDIVKRVSPTKMDAVNALTSVPTSWMKVTAKKSVM